MEEGISAKILKGLYYDPKAAVTFNRRYPRHNSSGRRKDRALTRRIAYIILVRGT